MSGNGLLKNRRLHHSGRWRDGDPSPSIWRAATLGAFLSSTGSMQEAAEVDALRPWFACIYSFPPEVELALHQPEDFPQLARHCGETGEFRRTGFVRIVHPGESELLKQNVAMQKGSGREGRTDRPPSTQGTSNPTGKWMKVELAAYEPDSDMATATLSPTIS